jgi:hypothetical protein
MTSIEWLESKVPNAFKNLTAIKALFEQAKEMHRQEILDAFTEGASDGYDGYYDSNREKYYNETFKKIDKN